MTQFVFGLLLIPGAWVAFLILKVLTALASKAWHKLHMELLWKIDIPKKASIFKPGTAGYIEPKLDPAVEKFIAAFRTARKAVGFAGLGWVVVVVRDTKSTGSDN